MAQMLFEDHSYTPFHEYVNLLAYKLLWNLHISVHLKLSGLCKNRLPHVVQWQAEIILYFLPRTHHIYLA